MNNAVVVHPPGRPPFATLGVQVSFGFAVCRQVGRVDAARGAERRHKQSDHRWGGHRVGDRAGMIGGWMISDLLQRLGKRPAGYAATPEVGLDRCAGGGEGVSPQRKGHRGLPEAGPFVIRIGLARQRLAFGPRLLDVDAGWIFTDDPDRGVPESLVKPGMQTVFKVDGVAATNIAAPAFPCLLDGVDGERAAILTLRRRLAERTGPPQPMAGAV